MSWKDLLQKEVVKTFPWVGGRILTDSDYSEYHIQGKLPADHGWYKFILNGKKASFKDPCDIDADRLTHKQTGYLVGDRFLSDRTANVDLRNLATGYDEVHLVEDGLERFSRVAVGRLFQVAPLIYMGQEMPLGPEEEVLTAFLDQKDSIDAIAGVTPALDAAFRMETMQRVEAERRRLEEARRLQEEEERRQREEARQKLVEQLGDGAGRRAMARQDFNEAARAALAIGGAEFLDAKRAPRRGEMVVKFRLDGQRFECTCSAETLNIIDSGICLTAHYDDDDFEYGTKGDTWFSLESLPSVIREAVREGKLVVYRHVN